MIVLILVIDAESYRVAVSGKACQSAVIHTYRNEGKYISQWSIYCTYTHSMYKVDIHQES